MPCVCRASRRGMPRVCRESCHQSCHRGERLLCGDARHTQGMPLRVRAVPLYSHGLFYSCSGEIAYESVKVSSLLFLQMRAALVKNTDFDAWVDALEGSAGLGWRERAFAAPDGDNRDLQAGERLVDIQYQVVAEERGSRITTVGLVRAGIDVFNQFVGNQTGIVETLLVIVATDSTTRGEQVVDELADNRQP